MEWSDANENKVLVQHFEIMHKRLVYPPATHPPLSCCGSLQEGVILRRYSKDALSVSLRKSKPQHHSTYEKDI
jgi:hypothetical protein